MNKYKNKPYRTIFLSFSILLLDQVSKILVLNLLGFQKSTELIPGIIKLTLVKNTGAAFSLFSEITPLLTLTSILASIIIFFIIFNLPKRSYWNHIALANLLGGTLGNGLDRLFRGHVLDFINLVPVNFPIFNIADIAINIAILCFLIDIIKNNKSIKNKNVNIL
tara:strand:+ start:543 stop:1037 length:495 start_codon:yes stop_codon:yes gene_type:complete